MVLQRLINWIVVQLITRFKPIITYAKSFPEAIDPTQEAGESLGYDLYNPFTMKFEPGEQLIINTGLRFQFPSYLGMFFWDKSSIARRYQLNVRGGVIDPDFRGSVGVILKNCNDHETVVLPAKTAIAQMVFHFRICPELFTVTETELSTTIRGRRGFGIDDDWEKAEIA